MSSPTTPARSARAEHFLGLFPETLPPDQRVAGVLKKTSFPGGVGWNVLTFLQTYTLQRHWDRDNADQTARLQAMVTGAIVGGYPDWTAFLKDLHPYLEEFGYAKFVKGKPVKPMAAAAESKDSHA